MGGLYIFPRTSIEGMCREQLPKHSLTTWEGPSSSTAWKFRHPTQSISLETARPMPESCSALRGTPKDLRSVWVYLLNLDCSYHQSNVADVSGG